MNTILTVTENTISYRAPNGDDRHWYHEECNNNENLLITIGDSWTWGDHLGSIDWKDVYDDPMRLQVIYGKTLATHLKSDWILMANPGCSNYWMLDKLKLYKSQIQQLKSKYKKIYLVVVLTEDLRECSYKTEWHHIADYYSILSKSDNLEEFLTNVEKKLFLEFKNVFDSIGITARITRAFTDIWPDNKKYLGEYLLDKTWCDVFQDKINFSRYYQVVPFIGQMAIEPLTNLYISKLPEPQLDSFKKDFIELEQKLMARWNFLGESKYNLKGSTYHPSAEGHSIFAEYLNKRLHNEIPIL